jgi:hypothetical protein
MHLTLERIAADDWFFSNETPAVDAFFSKGTVDLCLSEGAAAGLLPLTTLWQLQYFRIMLQGSGSAHDDTWHDFHYVSQMLCDGLFFLMCRMHCGWKRCFSNLQLSLAHAAL